MTAMTWPDHLLSLEEFEQLPEDNSRRYELQEGVLHVTPKAASLHQRVVGALISSSNPQLSDEWEAVPDVEVVLVQVWPPTLRVPDVGVASSALIDQNPNRLNAKDILLTIEVISPGSRRTDTIFKAHEYAKAGIPFYWVVDLSDHVTLTEHRLDTDQGLYKTCFQGGEVFYTGHPCELRLDLDDMARRPGGHPSRA
jgi:Uma2 family endonuclease